MPARTFTLPCPQCGVVRTATYGSLPEAKRRRCGRCAKTRHGAKGSRLHNIWCSMRQRCRGTAGEQRVNDAYFGRGIIVCPEWERFEAFRDWALANGYAHHLTLDRRDNDGPYSPDNCRWSTATTQARNSRKARLTVQSAGWAKAQHRAGAHLDDIAAALRVSRGCIENVVYGRTWNDV